jgi:hypothetical protein
VAVGAADIMFGESRAIELLPAIAAIAAIACAFPYM